ncbi:very short patch repair endonuclease [Erwinia psidii]|uniref:Very short patch repair endonuclease n=1 Tax=Erwinia psidii TaxID=69224 RepID=A0A3N6SD61_9GAMM|nr:DNA mismatch endonuclease Vsr [Erwinia psidii]MCX8956333.1 DNA mismatch endonuclease Vsr [Erwinia psidii]MCX8959907.1 DNA mismatch endonuclease Vsr [Erwinia psidii]MCX8963453.1 DNA mismatch endonuclease Vsr [Erwinia psidii]RQM39370.1 DNA mismatch endonuclease Vsr [Erwinia psidii]
MADIHTSAVRSKNMRAIRTRDTAIENRLAELLVELGLSYDVQDKTLPGRPDFVLAQYQTVIFVHGCFWHHHHCHLFKVPATRTDFWMNKIDGNVARDRRDIAALSAAGWKVLVVWECALRGKTRLEQVDISTRLEEWICAGEGNGEIDAEGIRQRL